jgi:UDPglucose 6-dehydrogenase
MKIGIIGIGVIGTACKYGFEKLGHEIKIHDIKLNTSINEVLETKVTFICVPTPSNSDGSCNTSIVEKVVNELKDNNYKGIVAIKSTVTPTTTSSLMEKTKLKMCFVPEFLRERCAISDFIENHDILAIGAEDSFVYETIKKCHGNYPKNVVQMKPTEAELLKYYSNVFNALKITFANEMYEICEKLNIDYTTIKDSFIKRGTTKDIYLDVNENFRGYAGVCLPKDTKALDFFVKSIGLDLKLFETIDNENNKFKKTVFNGMRLD